MTKDKWNEHVQKALGEFFWANTEFDADGWPVEKARMIKLVETIDEITFIFNSENKVKIS